MDMIRIYLDTNVYSRPFDDQTYPNIQEEANAFLEIISGIKTGQLTLLSSDILVFEVNNIFSLDRRTKVRDYLDLCAVHLDHSEDILNLGKRVHNECQIRARDALHIAAAILGGARYFLSCDKQVIKEKSSVCYQQIAQSYRRGPFTVMNPAVFVEKMKRGRLK